MLAQNKENNYFISNITIGNLLEWEDRCILPSEISQIWVGQLPRELFPTRTYIILLFLTLFSQHIIHFIFMLSLLALGAAVWAYKHLPEAPTQVHAKLNSGDILSFSAKEEDILRAFYYALKGAMEGNFTSKTTFDTDGNLVGTSEMEAPATVNNLLSMDVSNSQNKELLDELQKLYKGCETKTKLSSEILDLINDTASFIAKDDRVHLQGCLRKFVTLGMVKDCNELGLNLLIEEIKGSLY